MENDELSEIKRKSTRKWAEDVQYNAEKLFSKVVYSSCLLSSSFDNFFILGN